MTLLIQREQDHETRKTVNCNPLSSFSVSQHVYYWQGKGGKV